MKDNYFGAMLVCVALGVMIFFFGVMIGVKLSKNAGKDQVRMEAVEVGVAEYRFNNSKIGSFHWKVEE